RGRPHRRRERVAAPAAPDPAGTRARAAGGRHHHRVGLFPAVRRTLRDVPGRPAAEHGERAVPDVRTGLQVVDPRHRVGGGLPAVRADRRRDQRPDVVRAPAGRRMKPLPAKLAVNAALVALAVVAAAPLLWMLSVSFMRPGEAAAFPPPLLPDAPT